MDAPAWTPFLCDQFPRLGAAAWRSDVVPHLFVTPQRAEKKLRGTAQGLPVCWISYTSFLQRILSLYSVCIFSNVRLREESGPEIAKLIQQVGWLMRWHFWLPCFEFQLGHRLSLHRFRGFLSPSRQMPWIGAWGPPSTLLFIIIGDFVLTRGSHYTHEVMLDIHKWNLECTSLPQVPSRSSLSVATHTLLPILISVAPLRSRSTLSHPQSSTLGLHLRHVTS
jgi:hypothetical protein